MTRVRAENLLKRHGYDDGGPVSDRPPVTDYPTRVDSKLARPDFALSQDSAGTGSRGAMTRSPKEYGSKRDLDPTLSDLPGIAWGMVSEPFRSSPFRLSAPQQAKGGRVKRGGRR